MSEEMDFATLFENSLKNVKTDLRTGEKVSGIVSKITKENIILDLGLRNDGLLDIKDLQDKDGNLKIGLGDTVTAFNMGVEDGYFKLQVRAGGKGGEANIDGAIADAFEAKMPIEGKVTAERKGGFSVAIGGAQAFCPFSQIDARGVKKEPAEYIGNTYSFLITEFSEEGRNIVLSRRSLVEEEKRQQRDALKESLELGAICQAEIVRVLPFGAFADIGGVEGLIPVSEISWTRGVNAEECLTVGQKISVKVIALEWGDDSTKERITLSIKQAVKSPWDRIADGEETKYSVGSKHHGKVVRVADFGAFVELEPGLDGLAHISQLGQEGRVEKVSDVCKIGDEVDVTILELDGERKRIRLCFGDPRQTNEKAAELSLEQEQEVARLSLGTTITGEVDSIRPFGVFVKLPDGRTGLLHISQCGLEDSGALRSRELSRKFPLHAKVDVIIREMNGNRISLTLPEVLEQEMERNTVMDYKDGASASFGTLGDAFSQIKL